VVTIIVARGIILKFTSGSLIEGKTNHNCWGVPWFLDTVLSCQRRICKGSIWNSWQLFCLHRLCTIRRFLILIFLIWREGELANFFIGLSDTPKYDIIMTENGDVIDGFIAGILTFKACPTRIKHKLNVKFSFSVQIMSYLSYANKKIANSPFKLEE